VVDDERPDATPAVVLSDRFWTREFARAPDVVGRDVVINGTHATVVGVIRESFVGLLPLTPDIWMTVPTASRLGATPGRLDDETNRFIDVRARLKPGVTMAQAEAEISGLVAEREAPNQSVGEANRIVGAMIRANDSMLPMTWQTALIVAPALVVVVLVLVIACANLANLMLSRALARQREIAVRLSLGASRSRLLRQLLTESLVIASLGATLGFLVGRWTVLVVSRAYFARIPATFGAIALDLRPSWHVAAYAVALGVGSVLVFGLAPALYATSGNLVASLKGDDSTFGTRIRRSRFRDALVAIQVAGCFVLLVAAGTLAASIQSLGQRAGGFRPDRVTVATLGLAAAGHVSPALETARATLAARATHAPGVDAVARALFVPYASWYPRLSVAAANDAMYRRLQYNAITPGYFDVMGQRIVRGRAFAADDSASAARVAIVTEAAARELWPTSSPLDQTLRVSRGGNQPDELYRVVGVAADAHAGMVWDNDDDGYVFVPATSRHFADYDMPLLVRSEGPTPPLQRTLLDLGRQIDPNAPLDVAPALDGRSLMLTPVHYAAWLTSAVGMFGLGLALIGLYGVVAFAVAQRRHEIAVHNAMGAMPRDVLRLVLRRELRLVVVGLGAGLVMATGESALIQAWVLPLTPLGVSGFALLAAMLLVVATTAALVPAAGALRIAPMDVLRRD
jgi:predicted permease